MVSRLPKWIWFGGAVLAFNAGMINVIAFMSFAHQAASHMTGIFTHLSIEIYQKDRSATWQAGVALLSFFIGAMICGILIRDAHLRMGRRYSLALFIESGLLAAATFLFYRKNIWGEYLACMAAGLQNAMVSTYSGTIVRTTHMTGVLTDFGSLIGQWLVGIKVERAKLELLFGLMISFFWGGVAGGFLYQRVEYMAMIIPSFIVGCAGLGYLVIRHFKSR